MTNNTNSSINYYNVKDISSKLAFTDDDIKVLGGVANHFNRHKTGIEGGVLMDSMALEGINPNRTQHSLGKLTQYKLIDLDSSDYILTEKGAYFVNEYISLF